jgi:hypothetical protein
VTAWRPAIAPAAGPGAPLAVKSWLEWEQSALLPAVYSGSAAACLEQLGSALKGPYIGGSSPSAADVSSFPRPPQEPAATRGAANSSGCVSGSGSRHTRRAWCPRPAA